MRAGKLDCSSWPSLPTQAVSLPARVDVRRCHLAVSLLRTICWEEEGFNPHFPTLLPSLKRKESLERPPSFSAGAPGPAPLSVGRTESSTRRLGLARKRTGDPSHICAWGAPHSPAVVSLGLRSPAESGSKRLLPPSWLPCLRNSTPCSPPPTPHPIAGEASLATLVKCVKTTGHSIGP